MEKLIDELLNYNLADEVKNNLVDELLNFNLADEIKNEFT